MQVEDELHEKFFRGYYRARYIIPTVIDNPMTEIINYKIMIIIL